MSDFQAIAVWCLIAFLCWQRDYMADRKWRSIRANRPAAQEPHR